MSTHRSQNWKLGRWHCKVLSSLFCRSLRSVPSWRWMYAATVQQIFDDSKRGGEHAKKMRFCIGCSWFRMQRKWNRGQHICRQVYTISQNNWGQNEWTLQPRRLSRSNHCKFLSMRLIIKQEFGKLILEHLGRDSRTVDQFFQSSIIKKKLDKISKCLPHVKRLLGYNGNLLSYCSPWALSFSLTCPANTPACTKLSQQLKITGRISTKQCNDLVAMPDFKCEPKHNILK